MVHVIKKGLELPISGVPSQKIVNANPVKTVAVTGFDYVGMKPTMLVAVGDKVKIGQPLFECKKVEGVMYTSPACGTVKQVNRGDRRIFQNIIIEVEGSEHHSFSSYQEKNVSDYSDEEAEKLLVESGSWAGFRTRPFSKAPSIGSRPSSIFVSLIDTNPLSPDPIVVLSDYEADFVKGLDVISKLANVNLIKGKGASLPSSLNNEKVKASEFCGPHPAGNVGTHIHFIDPVGPKKTVWHIGYQEVIAIGRLFSTGKLFLERVVSLGGPKVFSPRLLRTRIGANINDLIEGQLKEGPVRVISGSIFSGRRIDETFCYLGRFHQQISVIEEDNSREFLGWQGPGFDKFSIQNTFAGKFKNKSFSLNSKLFGSPRAIVPIGSYEKVMPMDILATPLLKALVTKDVDQAQALGCLELDEEDLALCTFASPGKTDFGPLLRENLTIIEKEG